MRRKLVSGGAASVSNDAAQLERAQLAAGVIGQATDTLNAALSRAEKVFADLGLGVSASVCLRRPTSDDLWFQNFNFQKDGNEWRFILQSGEHGDDPDYWSESPLLSASREVRLSAARMLPDLLEELIAQAERQAASLTETSSKVDAFLDSLERSQTR
jgi:hypothetical protein